MSCQQKQIREESQDLPNKLQDHSHDVMANVTRPEDFIRHDVVSTAVNFLLDPRVRITTEVEKRHFLLKKGLTLQEIDAAIKHAGLGIPYSIKTSLTSFPNTHVLSNRPYLPTVGPTHFHQQVHYGYPGAFVMTRALVPSIAIASSLFYGLYLLWKKYLEPIIYGHNNKKHPLVLIQENLTKLQETIDLLNVSVKQLEVNIVDKMKQEIESKARPSPQETAAIDSIKKELSSIKSLLLGRKQFPEAPVHQKSIPSWQLTDEEAKDRQ